MGNPSHLGEHAGPKGFNREALRPGPAARGGDAPIRPRRLHATHPVLDRLGRLDLEERPRPRPGTGAFFEVQTSEAIQDGVRRVEAAWADGRITAAGCRARAERFSVEAFRAGVLAEVARVAQPLVMP